METGPFPDARRLIIVPVTRLDLRVAPLEPNSPHSVDLGTRDKANYFLRESTPPVQYTPGV